VKQDILICGVGGQGTVLASRVLAAAAMEAGHPVHSAETIGMAQRGGSVTSHIRIGAGAWSPLIPPGGADMLLAFEPAEAVRNLSFLRPEGIAIVNTAATRPVGASLKDTGYDGREMVAWLKDRCACVFVDGEAACRPFGSARYLNIVLLGAALGTGRLELTEELIRNQIRRYVPARFLETNLKAFEAGLSLKS